jgi:proteasome lid subunit RPN8/RPN11
MRAEAPPSDAPGRSAIRFDRGLHDRLVAAVLERFPTKTFGYLLATAPGGPPVDLALFETNVRNDRVWRPRFQSYGRYFVEHDDAGFVASSEESWRVQQEIWRRGLVEVGVFHSHQRHPANFSRIDYELHRRHMESLWHLIVSMRNPRYPRLRAFSVGARGVRELDVLVEDASGAGR